ncbi:MAG: AAA family ATPase [Fibromonadaceae bacterium]|jgi:superfamily I DNA and/or RNA helicase|nr:AAA family ATPase [Fibromonadaceae bacterium]
MQNYNGYTPVAELQDLGKRITLWECQKNGDSYEVLHIPYGKEYESMLKRIMQNVIKPLINEDITGIQRVIDCGTLENKDFFIVYEKIEDAFSEKIEVMKDIAIGLNDLKKKNQEIFFISKNSIKNKLQFIGLYEFLKKVDLLDRDYLSPNAIDWLEDKTDNLPNYQDDIYSLVKVFENSLNDEVLQKGLAVERTERFSKYSDLIDLLSLMNQKILKILINDEYVEKFTQILEEMNRYCELCIGFKKGDQEQIAVKFRTDNWEGIFYVDDGKSYGSRNYVFIPVQSCNPRKELKSNNAGWFVADFSFFRDKESTFNSLDFFTEKFDNINQLASLNKTKKENVEKWQTMPEKEKEFIEENAFCVGYNKVTFKKANATFNLVNSFNNWEVVKKHKNEGTLIYVDGLKVGKIGEFHSTNNIIVIKDIMCEPEEIAKEGELSEDTKQKVSQFKKQIEACQNFLTLKVVNPVICSILATSDLAAISPNKMLGIEYNAFKKEIFNKNLQTDETQLEAVLEAITYKPIYLIQGPPGTGKTTVIVECIRQIIKREPNAKILITSQSNLAVDNVLEKILEINPEEQNLKFMRLASESAEREINVTESIKPHTYEEKLKSWVKNTLKNSEEFIASKFSEQEKNEILVKFYFRTKSIESFDKFKEELNKQSNNYLKNLFGNTKNIQDVKKIFEDILSPEYLKLKDIQREWRAFLNNASKGKKQSKLNKGSERIDFLTAMMEGMNIIGATCIHIASAKYADVNFKFDYVIMDESSKASPAETLVPINMGRNIIFIGDHKQLPPVVTREDAIKQKIKEELEDNGLDVEKEFGESLFEKLITAFEADESKQRYVKMLNIQYRMPKQIGSLISKFFYNGKLNNPDEEVIPNFDEDKKHNLNLKKDTSIVFLSTSKRENCNDDGNKYFRQNKCNMETIKETLEKLNELYKDNSQKENPFTIGVIAGYRGQVELLRKSINTEQYCNFIKTDDNGIKTNLIEINTVDKFQGAERDIIIYDIVRSDKGSSNIGFLDDYRRINVAFSRAKRLLIIVGDSEYIIKRATLNPGGKFPEFKLQEIAKELQEEGLVFNNLEEVLK